MASNQQRWVRRTKVVRVVVLCGVAAAFAISGASCSSKMIDGTDSNTHWLDSCTSSADCGALECVCGKCTRRCDGSQACASFGATAECGVPSGCAGSSTTACVVASSCSPGGCSPEGGMGSTGGACPPGAVSGATCDGSILQCWTQCTSGLQGQLACTADHHWLAGKGVWPCGPDAGPTPVEITCPAGVASGGACGAGVSGCTTPCNGGFRSHFDCTSGHWLAGHGLLQCGDGGRIGCNPELCPSEGTALGCCAGDLCGFDYGAGCMLKLDAGLGDPCAPMDAHTGGLPCIGGTIYAWNGSRCAPVAACSCDGKDCGLAYSSETACYEDHAACLARRGVSFACTVAADCALTSKACCASCNPRKFDETIAVALTSRAAWSTVVCNPTETCPPCIPPDGTLRAECVQGQCQVVALAGSDAGP